MKYIDAFLDRITMYRLLLDYLLVLLGAAMLLGAVGIIHYSPVAIAAGAGYLTLVCWQVNKLFGRAWRAPVNPESSILTALILALIINPPTQLADFGFLTVVALLAMASKYMLAIRRKHLFNPAAIAVVLTALMGGSSASWWVGNAILAPLVAAGGYLLVRKIRRGRMVLVFFGAALVTTAVIALFHGASPLVAASNLVLRSSLLFLGFVMLTEPLTSPSTWPRQAWFAALTGVLFSPQFNLAGVYFAPELALVVGNAAAYFMSPAVNVLPRLKRQEHIGTTSRDFIFALDQPLAYQAGQYMEWTLPHHQPDNRGARRYFTLASSPTEPELRLGLRFYQPGSTYKRAMLQLAPGQEVAAGSLGGDFTLPRDAGRKLAFIAGGIGVTPFRSMVKYVHDTGAHRDITLLYSERNAGELAYRDVFDAAAQAWTFKTTYVLTDSGAIIPDGMSRGPVTAELIAATVPDYAERLFYVSGPHPMVQAVKKQLRGLGVPGRHIKEDFFSGYA
jgi:ferredoxin-NADP reductase/Na+-transporting NADH:ubiquinone oxidoreductase subunit NqrB